MPALFRLLYISCVIGARRFCFHLLVASCVCISNSFSCNPASIICNAVGRLDSLSCYIYRVIKFVASSSLRFMAFMSFSGVKSLLDLDREALYCGVLFFFLIFQQLDVICLVEMNPFVSGDLI